MKRVYMIEIELENEVFGGGGTGQEADQVISILTDVQWHLRNDGCLADHSLTDSNGNRVGRARVAKRSK